MKTSEWLRKAAEKGNAYAQNNLGYCNERGQGVAKNINIAIEWYKKSAKQNDKNAINALKRLGVNYPNI